jgi:PAP2 superfamily C-terminal
MLMISPALSAWRSALQGKSFKVKLIISIALLFLCAWLAPIVFQYAEQRQGVLLPDVILEWLAPKDLSLFIFIIMDALLVASVAALLTKPHHFLIVLQAYVILTLVRFATILLIPLDAPENLVLLHDPITDRFFYRGAIITKDLFFSGHTSILMLMAFGVPFRTLKALLFAGGILVGIMLLIQHAHYTIDVLVAPVFAWLVLTVSRRIHQLGK